MPTCVDKIPRASGTQERHSPDLARPRALARLAEYTPHAGFQGPTTILKSRTCPLLAASQGSLGADDSR